MLNITPTRLKLLQLLSERGEYCVAKLAYVIAPRNAFHPWTAQGAARWGGGYIKPLEQAGMVLVNRMVSSGVGMVSLTDQGRKTLTLIEGEKNE